MRSRLHVGMILGVWAWGAAALAGTDRVRAYEFEAPPRIGRTAAGDELFLGGFSGLAFVGKDDRTGALEFFTHTDRGPNTEPVDLDGDGVEKRGFALPAFSPEIVRFTFDPASRKIQFKQRIALKKPDGRPLTGLPNLPSSEEGPWSDEIGIDLRGHVLPADSLGVDPEGLVIAPDGTFWMGDEYRPALLHFAADGTMLERYVPTGGPAELGIPALPPVLAHRKTNKGFEALARVGDKLYAFLQSSLVKKGRNVRVIEFDLRTRRTTGQYLYKLSRDEADKIGDATALPDGRLLVVERDDERGNDADKKLYAVDFSHATNLLDLHPRDTDAASGIDDLSASELRRAGITLPEKELALDVVAKGFDYADKLEGLTMVDDHTLAFVNDNDFALSGYFDADTGRLVPAEHPATSVLGLYSGF